ncbi:MAG: hypothetical protein RSG54_10430 [Clostridium sp.]
MDKAEEDLKAILNSLAEWRDEHDIGYVTMYILDYGNGGAYTLPSSTGYEVSGVYTDREKEPDGGNRTGSGNLGY